MRHHWRDQFDQRFNSHSAISSNVGFFNRVHQVVNPSDRFVECKCFNIFADCFNGLMGLAPKTDIFTLKRHVSMLTEQPPQALNEPRAALDPGFRPRQIALGRRIGQHEPADRVGTVGGDDLVGVDHVLLRLRHLKDAANFDWRAIYLESRTFACSLDF